MAGAPFSAFAASGFWVDGRGEHLRKRVFIAAVFCIAAVCPIGAALRRSVPLNPARFLVD
jgi:hypothetical protein